MNDSGMCLGAKVKVRCNRVFEELDDQITGKKECHGADHSFRSIFAGASIRPEADSFGRISIKIAANMKPAPSATRYFSKRSPNR